ncbi:NAD(P)-dependent alcohol dehydrogenase [Maribacter algarum]|uniref:NAD(P)-dependent alcohol dehydrogenase n=1 Tax=Maribacter algarum (ex Zhang et al. 2020) TaxID=2578118 RepID=A0A5S3PKA8_9FLAO|nr:NAD(P)-dependent alcohol dehydrogenase [Maribacter algarum]TMM53911.1 NAD(P)-dependent alcohol dehydrogenase [Maribacter algarum]
MKAVTRTKYGPPEVLEVKEILKPQPEENELLIRVHATTVNRTDCGILTGKPYLIRAFVGLTKPRHLVPGTDFAGQVEAIGSDVTAFQIGDRVWGLHDEGLESQAEYMTIGDNKAVVKIPENISYQEVVACAEGAHYANNFINKVKIDSSTKVLVNGATGAIGSAAVQLLKYHGAKVTAVGNTKNMNLVQSLGSDKTIDYQKEDFTKDDEKYHFVFDAVGKSSFPECKHLLLPKGVYISSELGPNAQNLYLPLTTKIKGGKRVIFPLPVNCKKSILFMSKLLSEGKFKPVIDRVYQPEQIVEAYNYVASGQKTGNVIINFSPLKD